MLNAVAQTVTRKHQLDLAELIQRVDVLFRGDTVKPRISFKSFWILGTERVETRHFLFTKKLKYANYMSPKIVQHISNITQRWWNKLDGLLYMGLR